MSAGVRLDRKRTLRSTFFSVEGEPRIQGILVAGTNIASSQARVD